MADTQLSTAPSTLHAVRPLDVRRTSRRRLAGSAPALSSALLAAVLAACGGSAAAQSASAPSGVAPEPGLEAAPTAGEPPSAPLAPTRSDYANVDGLRIYYEVYGSGKPLVLLHGGICTIEACLGPLVPRLASGRQLIAIEQQAHGHTADLERPLTFEQMAEDTVAVLRVLQVERADFFGYSDGGNVALRVAMTHPALVDRLAVYGTNASNEGLAPGLVEAFATLKGEDMPPEFRQAYEKVAPDPKQFGTLVRKVMDQALAFEGWSKEQMQSVQAPVLIAVGDRDIVLPEHAVEMFRQLPHGQLAVLAARDHGAPITAPAEIGALVDRFLRGPLPGAGGFGGH